MVHTVSRTTLIEQNPCPVSARSAFHVCEVKALVIGERGVDCGSEKVGSTSNRFTARANLAGITSHRIALQHRASGKGGPSYTSSLQYRRGSLGRRRVGRKLRGVYQLAATQN